MKDKYELPIWNHINFHMFYELYDSFNRKQQNIAIRELIERVDKKIGGNPSIKDFYRFMNPGIVLSLLYTNLVIPKEIFSNDDFGEKYFEKFEISFDAFFTFDEVDDKYVNSKFRFIKMLRNAVAHANFEWTNSKSILKFWNFYRNEKNFIVSSNLTDLCSFALKVSEYMGSSQMHLKSLK